MQSSSSLVTVGIPTYNRPEGLERTLASITNQTYQYLEIIISDNFSERPEVLTIIKKYADQDKRISYYVQEKNISIVPNFQFLLDKAQGEYFMWAADDDNWDANFIEVCVKSMEGNKDVVLCMTDLKLVGEDGVACNSKMNRSFMQRNLFSRCFNFVKSKSENKYFFLRIIQDPGDQKYSFS